MYLKYDSGPSGSSDAERYAQSDTGKEGKDCEKQWSAQRSGEAGRAIPTAPVIARGGGAGRSSGFHSAKLGSHPTIESKACAVGIAAYTSERHVYIGSGFHSVWSGKSRDPALLHRDQERCRRGLTNAPAVFCVFGSIDVRDIARNE